MMILIPASASLLLSYAICSWSAVSPSTLLLILEVQMYDNRFTLGCDACTVGTTVTLQEIADHALEAIPSPQFARPQRRSKDNRTWPTYNQDMG
ncbi:hypothetical protein LXA43DRAFT_581909 [Ganoderma leucocontextum]|nr:hypothetical protein LXA43DRAFT_581909 [Ganoderma leucocontextum]